MSSTLTNLTAATTWSGTDLFYALVGGNSRKIAASSFWICDAANVLSDVNSTTAQTVRVYRTFTDSSNYERLALQSGVGYFEIAAQTAGTGTDNVDMRVTAAGDGYVYLNGFVRNDFTTALTNNSVVLQTVRLSSTGTTTAGFGFTLNLELENASNSLTTAARIDCYWDDATAASEDTHYRIALLKAGSLFYAMRLDAPTTATHTSLWIYDVDNNATERVSVGAADSGGSGFKVLRIAN